MAIQIDDAETIPQLTYSYIFMRNLTIVQRLRDNESQPVYTLSIEVQKYAIDDKGVRHFLPKVHVIRIDDYLPLAVSKAQQGDTALVEAMKAIEKALASILEVQGFAQSINVL